MADGGSRCAARMSNAKRRLFDSDDGLLQLAYRSSRATPGHFKLASFVQLASPIPTGDNAGLPSLTPWRF